MLERLSLDPAVWARTETAQTSELLMAVAGALSATGLVASRHVDSLRIDLAAMQAYNSASQQDPPLLSLSRSGCEFLRLLESRYGSDRLVLNLFRYGVKAWARETCLTLNRWGHTTLKNYELVLNRSIIIYRSNQEPGDERLFSSLMLDMAARIDTCADAIESLSARLNAWHGNPVPNTEDDSAEQVVAERTGMRGIVHDTAPGHDEEYFVRRVALELATLAQFTSHFTTQITTNLDLPANVLLEMRSKWLQTEATRLSSFSWPHGPGIVSMEVARNHLMMVLSSMTGALLDIEAESTRLLPGRLASEIESLQRQRVESLRGNLIADAMLAGLSAKDAEDSVIGLITFTEKHALSAREVITSELNKIHPALMPRTLERFQKLTAPDPLAQNKSAEKSRGASKAMHLLGRFTERSQRLPLMALMIAVFFAGAVAGGCGLKTAPKSDIDDLRPEIPFRNKP